MCNVLESYKKYKMILTYIIINIKPRKQYRDGILVDKNKSKGKSRSGHILIEKFNDNKNVVPTELDFSWVCIITKIPSLWD